MPDTEKGDRSVAAFFLALLGVAVAFLFGSSQDALVNLLEVPEQGLPDLTFLLLAGVGALATLRRPLAGALVMATAIAVMIVWDGDKMAHDFWRAAYFRYMFPAFFEWIALLLFVASFATAIAHSIRRALTSKG